MTLPPLFLASASPRRRQLLDNAGLRYTVLEPDAVEASPSATEVDAVTRANALAKAKSVLAKLPTPEAVAIGADTLVVVDGEVMGKPKDTADVKRMLGRLSGRDHEVVTGIALVSRQFGSRDASAKTRVRFRSLAAAEIADYASTREPYDKAGSYAIQGLAMLFVDRIEGSYTNVIGLPMETLLPELAALTRLPLSRWFQ